MLFAVLAGFPGAGAGCSVPMQRFEYVQPHMGTRIRLALYSPNEALASKAAEAAFDRIAQLNATLSDYESDSELSRLSRSSGGGQAVKVSDDLWQVLSRAQQMAEASGGAFDITVGPIVRQWRRARARTEMPTQENLREALAATGYEKLRLDEAARTATLTVPGMRLDPGGIGKGYAADEALEVLRDHGIDRAMVDAGGNVAAGDAPPGERGWKIALMPMPDVEQSAENEHEYVWIENEGISTSGAGFQSVVIDGVRYSHIVDPHTGIGLTEPIAVTVIAEDATLADALSTAISVLGVERGLKLAERFDANAMIFVQQPDGTVRRFNTPPTLIRP